MNVLIIRHAEAAEAADGPDEQRPLTKDGRKQSRRTAKAIKKLVKRVDLLASSPLLRVMQTAEIIAERLDIRWQQLDALSPQADADDVIQWLGNQSPSRTIALVGHEPGLSRLIGLAVAGREASFVKLKKGAAAMIEFSEAPKPGGGLLLWLLTPAQIEELA